MGSYFSRQILPVIKNSVLPRVEKTPGTYLLVFWTTQLPYTVADDKPVFLFIYILCCFDPLRLMHCYQIGVVAVFWLKFPPAVLFFIGQTSVRKIKILYFQQIKVKLKKKNNGWWNILKSESLFHHKIYQNNKKYIFQQKIRQTWQQISTKI